jgi:tRNA nucleotidyltransferase (CCA-adding enzyme)
MTTGQSARWEHFEHMSDIGVRGFGRSPAEAFEQAALALTAVIVEPSQVSATEEIRIECPGRDPELLLADWLNALVYEMATRRLLFGRFSVKLDDTGLHASAWGEPVDVEKHHPAVEVKGATLTALSVRKDAAGVWRAQCVVDV